MEKKGVGWKQKKKGAMRLQLRRVKRVQRHIRANRLRHRFFFFSPFCLPFAFLGFFRNFSTLPFLGLGPRLDPEVDRFLRRLGVWARFFQSGFDFDGSRLCLCFGFLVRALAFQVGGYELLGKFLVDGCAVFACHMGA